MCGIVYMKSLLGLPVNQMVKEQFKKQRSRGIDGFGFTIRNEKALKIIHETDESLAIRKLRQNGSSEVLFHHRIPTSTNNVLNACHPFEVKGHKTGHKYIVVHNGMLWNDDDLKKKHKKLGNYKYRSEQPDGRFNDSEALAYEIMLAMENNAWEDFDAEGSIAFICQEVAKNGRPLKIHFARNSGSPLSMKYNGKTLQIASELNGESIEENTLYSIDYKTMSVKKKKIEMKEHSYSYTYYDESQGSRQWYWEDEKYKEAVTKKDKEAFNGIMPRDSFFEQPEIKEKTGQYEMEWFYDAGVDEGETEYFGQVGVKTIEACLEDMDKELSEVTKKIEKEKLDKEGFLLDYYKREERILNNKISFVMGMLDGIYTMGF